MVTGYFPCATRPPEVTIILGNRNVRVTSPKIRKMKVYFYVIHWSNSQPGKRVNSAKGNRNSGVVTGTVTEMETVETLVLQGK